MKQQKTEKKPEAVNIAKAYERKAKEFKKVVKDTTTTINLKREKEGTKETKREEKTHKEIAEGLAEPFRDSLIKAERLYKEAEAKPEAEAIICSYGVLKAVKDRNKTAFRVKAQLKYNYKIVKAKAEAKAKALNKPQIVRA
jgi:hypothetical protein